MYIERIPKLVTDILPTRLTDVAAIVDHYKAAYHGDAYINHERIIITIGKYVLTLAYIASTDAGEIDADNLLDLWGYERIACLNQSESGRPTDALETLELLARCGVLERTPEYANEPNHEPPSLKLNGVYRSPALDALS